MKTNAEKRKELRIKITTIKQMRDMLQNELEFYRDLLEVLEK